LGALPTWGQGETEALTKKCCYFLRNAPPGQPLDVTKEGELVRTACYRPSQLTAYKGYVLLLQDLLFGELSGNLLSSIESLLSYCYKPVFEAADPTVWGKADEEQRADFMGEMDHFIHNLAEVGAHRWDPTVMQACSRTVGHLEGGVSSRCFRATGWEATKGPD
jgi:hypothetical protein